VIIYAVERPQSSSGRLLDRVVAGKDSAIVDEVVLEEAERFFRAQRGHEFAWQLTQFARRTMLVVSPAEAKAYMGSPGGGVSRQLRTHRAAARAGAADESVVDRGGNDAPYPEELPVGPYTRRDFVRCLMIALIVGTGLVLINVRPTEVGAGGALGPDPLRIVANYAVPFLVASVSAYLANAARIAATHAD
jgi:hypothetical protein